MPRVESDAGFTLVGLMIAVVIVNVMLGVAASSWVTIDRRADEAEAIFRGQQIAAAIGCFQRTESRRPETLAELVEANCLRREWGDPLARDGNWRLLTVQDLNDGTIATLLGLTQPGAEAGEDSGIDLSSVGAGVFGPRAGAATPGTPGTPGILGRLGAGGTSLFDQSTQKGLVGVASSARGESLRRYLGRARYEEWLFLAEGLGG